MKRLAVLREKEVVLFLPYILCQIFMKNETRLKKAAC